MKSETDLDDPRIQRAIDGDGNALAELFEQHRARLRRMIELRMDRRVQGRVNASDVLQEAYVTLAQQIPNYKKDPKLPFFLWVRRITGQRLAKMHREHLGTKKRDAGLEVSLYRGGMPEASSFFMASKLVGRFTSAGRHAVRAEILAKLQEVLNEMDENDREIVALRHIEQLSNGEIAALLEITESAASHRYYRAICKLRDTLKSIPGMLD